MSTDSDRVKFTPGLRLAERFFEEAVQPILLAAYPDLPYAAALIGSGSEVLGFDDVMSTDHHWGPRLILFLDEAGYAESATTISKILAERLPPSVAGYPTNWSVPDPDDAGNQFMRAAAGGPINHRVEIATIAMFFDAYLAFDTSQSLEPADWLSFSEQHLRTVTAGAVYHDEIGLEMIRSRFEYYPHDVWLYLLAAGWARIGQEEHLMGRAGFAGDEIGSALIGARLVRDIMRLCFLMERIYAPYPKWFGTAFQKLDNAAKISPALTAILRAHSWQERDQHLVQPYEYLATMHNALGLTESLPETVISFHGRPFQVMAFHGFSDALLAQITDPAVKQIARRRPIGSIDQFSDSTDLLSYPEWRPLLRQLYTAEL